MSDAAIMAPASEAPFGLRLPAERGSIIELPYQVLDSLPMGMAITDKQGRFVWVNRALGELLGYRPEDLLKLVISDVLFSQDYEAAVAAAEAVFSGKVPGFELEERWVRASGEPVWVLERASASGRLEEAGPGPTAERPLLVRQILDISQRRRVEADLAEVETELRRRNTDLERSNADLAEFAYVISHDLSEPLRVISGHVRLLERRYADVFDEQAATWIGFAVDGCARLRRLIDDLLTFSRAGREATPPVVVQLDAIAANVLVDLGTAIAESGATVRLLPLPAVLGEPTQLSQVLANLIANAVKFRKPGASPTVLVTSRRLDSEWCEIRVEDDGAGVPERHRERIFRAFQRLHTREEYAGTGIGLAVCRKVVERHGGRIWVEDADLGGAAFCFTLPTKEEK
jgi:PAS domain S-box-containing protein